MGEPNFCTYYFTFYQSTIYGPKSLFSLMKEYPQIHFMQLGGVIRIIRVDEMVGYITNRVEAHCSRSMRLPMLPKHWQTYNLLHHRQTLDPPKRLTQGNNSAFPNGSETLLFD